MMMMMMHWVKSCRMSLCGQGKQANHTLRTGISNMQQGMIVELHMNLSFRTNLLPFHNILPTFHPKWMSCHEHLHLLLHQQFRWPVGGLSFYYQDTRGSLQFYRLLGLQEDRFHAHLTRSVDFRYSWSGETSNLMEKHTYNSCIHRWVH